GRERPRTSNPSLQPANLLSPSQAQSRRRCGASASKRGSEKSPERAADRRGNVTALHNAGYVILLAQAPANYAEQVALSAIEEDLTGTRKLASAGVEDTESLRKGLIPLLPIQNAPRLEAVDMPAEIRLRTTELPQRAVEAFLSDASVAMVAQALE